MAKLQNRAKDNSESERSAEAGGSASDMDATRQE